MTDPIKAKIQELCPDVMELKFGTRIKVRDGAVETIVTYSNYGHFTVVGRNVHGVESDIIEILGSPITLAVVLRAIEKTNNRNEIVVYTDGDFGERDSDGRFTSAYVKWNLEHDNYDQQSEECKQFIGSLLTNEK
jgi:hypothetical protein